METGKPSQKKKRRNYGLWTAKESQVLRRLLVEGVKKGWRDKNGSFSKLTIESKILPVLNKKLKSKINKTHTNYSSHLKTLRKEYTCYAELFRYSSGFGWDPIAKKFTAPDEVWEDYIKAHPNHEYMRDNTIDDFEDLQIIFESAIARGSNAFGLGVDTNAETFEVEDDLEATDDVDYPEDVGEANEATYVAHKEKLPARKRARINGNGDSTNQGDRSEKVISEMIGVSTHIINLIQQREERHQREAELRETERKQNNVWDAIKEIPCLEDHIRYDALTKIHSLKMKDVFVSMSVEERLGWICRNT